MCYRQVKPCKSRLHIIHILALHNTNASQLFFRLASSTLSILASVIREGFNYPGVILVYRHDLFPQPVMTGVIFLYSGFFMACLHHNMIHIHFFLHSYCSSSNQNAKNRHKKADYPGSTVSVYFSVSLWISTLLVNLSAQNFTRAVIFVTLETRHFA